MGVEGLLALSVMLALGNNLLLRVFRNRGLKNMGDVLLFNALTSFIWAAGMLIYGWPALSLSRGTLIWGVLYGAATAGFLLCKMMTLSTGPLSLSTLMGCCSLIIPTFLGAAIWREAVRGVQVAGVILLLAALGMCVHTGSREKPVTLRWCLWAAAFFALSGMVGLIFKAHQKSPGSGEINELILVGALTSGILLLAAALLQSGGRRPRLPGSAWPYLASSAITSLLYNRLNIYLTGKMPSVIFFPVFNGGVILGATIVGALILREKLKKAQLVGILAGALAIFMIGNLF